MNPSELSARLGKQLEQLAADRHPAYCVRYDYAGQYALDESGAIIALNLRGMALAEDPGPWLAELPRLRYLNLSECGLNELTLPELPELMVLNVSRNPELRTLQTPESFPKLLRAELSHCRLSAVQWPASPVLEFLNASRQEERSLAAWSFAAACPRLYYLDLSHNQLAGFSLGAGFDNLGLLCLEQNQLTRVQLTGRLPKLESLRLQNNRLETVSTDWLASAPNLLNLFLQENPIETKYRGFIEEKTPHEVVTSLRAVLANEARGTTRDNECKVLLIGNGKAGKSCLVHRLKEDKFLAEWDSTHAIELLPYRLGEWELMLWDFGGQDIYHATHRLFMQSDAVYLLLWNNETSPEVNPYTTLTENGRRRDYRNYGIEYWVHYTRILGKGSPLLIIQSHRNKDGIRNLPRPPSAYSEGFSYFKVHQIESSEDDWESNGYEDLLTFLRRAVRRVKPPDTEIAENFAAVRAWIRDKQRAGERLLTEAAFLAFAAQPDIDLINPLDVLANWLHKTGVVYYQPGRLADQIILDQAWAIRAVYALFDRKQHYYRFKEQKGVFSGAELTEIWSGQPENDPELFLQFMLSSEICFELTPEVPTAPYRTIPFAERSYLAPALLSEKKPEWIDEFWVGRDSWQLIYRYEFLHYGVIQSFIVRTKDLADTSKMWQYGTYLREGEQIAVVAAEHNELIVRTTQNSKQLLDKVRNLIENLQDAPAKVLLSYDGRNFVSLPRLEKFRASKNREIDADAGAGELIAFEPFNAFLSVNTQEKFNIAPEINSAEMSNEMIEIIRQLVSRGKIEQSFDVLMERAPDQFRNEIYLLKGRFQELTRKERMGIIANNEANVERSNIIYNLLQLTESAQQSITPAVEREPKWKKPANDGPQPEPKIKKILFVTANPTHTAKLQLEKEYREVQRHLEDHEVYRVNSLEQVNASEFIDGVFETKPYILHFSGHGKAENEDIKSLTRVIGVSIPKDAGLVLYDRDKRKPTLLPTDVIKDLFQSFVEDGTPLRVVLFNACYSEAQARTVSTLGYTVIGTVNAIKDTAAIEFSNGFYRAISRGENIEKAVRRGRTKARTAGLQSMDMIKVFQHGEEVSI